MDREDNPVFLIEFILVVGLVLAWALWELWSVRRSKDKRPLPADDDRTRPSE